MAVQQIWRRRVRSHQIAGETFELKYTPVNYDMRCSSIDAVEFACGYYHAGFKKLGHNTSASTKPLLPQIERKHPH